MSTSRNLRAFQRTFKQAFRSHHAPVRLPAVRAFSIPAFRKDIPAIEPHHSRRHQSTNVTPQRETSSDSAQSATAETASSTTEADDIALRKALSPAYQLWFTCKKCLERSGHTISKQAYHFGTCVINCPKCKSQHLISDHLKIFSDTKMTMEDIAKKYGQIMRKGRLGADGDVEFYDDEATKKVEQDARKKDG